MKKLLLIAVLALGVVACDKNELGNMDSMSINPIEAKVEAYDVDAIVTELLSNLSNFGTSKHGNANITGKTGDFIAVHIFSSVGVNYLILADESNDDFCFDSLTDAPATVYFDNSAGDGSVLSVEDGDGNVSLELKGDWTSFFSGANNVLVELNANNKSVEQAQFDADNAATIGS